MLYRLTTLIELPNDDACEALVEALTAAYDGIPDQTGYAVFAGELDAPPDWQRLVAESVSVAFSRGIFEESGGEDDDDGSGPAPA